MVNGKKAQVSFDEIIGIMMASVLFLIGLFFVVLPVVAGYSASISFTGEHLEYNLRAVRFISSSDCLAWEEKVGGNYQVHIGVIDKSKWDEGSDRLSKCFDGKFRVALDGDEITSTKLPEDTITEHFFVQIYDSTADKFSTGILEVEL